MSLIPHCTVCDAALDPYGQETRCDRCYEPCSVCGKDVSVCRHPLRKDIERDLRFTMELQRKVRAA